MDIWKELFGTIGWWVLPLMVIAWAIREWWGLKKHGEEERISGLIKIQFEKIKDFRKRLVGMEEQLTNLYYLYMPIGIDPPQVDIKKAIAEMRALKNIATEQEVYFSPNFKEKTRNMISALEGAMHSLEYRQIMIDTGGKGSEVEIESHETAFRLLNETIPILREELDKEIRAILGVI